MIYGKKIWWLAILGTGGQRLGSRGFDDGKMKMLMKRRSLSSHMAACSRMSLLEFFSMSLCDDFFVLLN